MAHLLGSKNCLESLSTDVLNLQEIINCIMEKVGKLDVASWKFPTKRSTQLDIDELVGDYSYCKDEDSNRLSHIIMFELVIDRFCLLLQSVTKLFDLFVSTNHIEEEERPKSRTVTSTMSVGLISKNFWGKLSQVQFTYHNMEKEVSEYNQSLMKLETLFLEMKVENEKLKTKHSNKSTKKQIQEDNTVESEKHQQENNATSNSSTQTYETSFTPCNACCEMQCNLLQAGSAVIAICESQGLPSSLAKQKKIIKNSQMVASDVARWASDQERDLKKINEYLDSMKSQIKPLQGELSSVQQSNKSLMDELKLVRTENSQLQTEMTKLQSDNESYKLVINENCKKIEMKDTTIAELEEEKVQTNKLLHETSDNVEKHKTSLVALEQGIKSLSSQLEQQTNEKEKLMLSESQLIEIKEKLRTTEERLQKTSIDFNKIKAENKVLLKHDQSLQTKQATLLSRLEKLDETCEELQKQLDESEEQKDEYFKLNEELKKEKQGFLKEIDGLQNELNNTANITLQSEVTYDSKPYEEELTKMSDKLKLLVCYPVIGGKYKSAEKEYTDIINDPSYLSSSDDDVMMDMERQLMANTTRMSVLKQQNDSLRNSLLKLDRANISHKTEEIAINKSNDRAFDKKTGNNSAPQRSYNQESTVVPRPPSEPRATSKPARPRSGNKNDKKESFNIGARLANLDRLKNAAQLNKNDAIPTKTAWSDNNTSSVICQGCDKIYLSKRDLDIHKAFCYGRI